MKNKKLNFVRLYGCTAVRLYGCTAACRQVENPTAVSLDSIKILVRLRWYSRTYIYIVVVQLG